MKIEKFGSGRNLFNIIVGVHGNESASIGGFFLLKKYLKNKSIAKSFSVIVANEKAIKMKKRFVKKDLNRCFPGSPTGVFEERLAYELTKETAKANFNFDFHSTVVTTRPYGIVSVHNKKLSEIMRATGIKEYVFVNSESLIKFAPNALAFEVGLEGDPKSEENAFAIMKNILVYFKIINEKTSFKRYKPSIYLIYHFVSKNKFSRISNKLADFKHVKKGDIIGYAKNETPVVASEGFYPILMNDVNVIKKAKKIIIEE